MSSKGKLIKGLTRVLRQCEAGHQLQIMAAGVEGRGPTVIVSAGDVAVMMNAGGARRLADAFSVPLAVAGGLTELATELRLAADVCDSKEGPVQ